MAALAPVNDDLLNERRQNLEEEFFRKQNEQQVAQLRAKNAREELRLAMKAATGLDSDYALDRLIALGIGPETIAAIGLVPLVAVAWANGKVEPAERDAILKATREAGVQAGSPGEQFLENWLREKPGDHLVEAWVEYMRGLVERLSPPERDKLRADVVGRARAVAEAAGGFLGLGSRISSEEAAVLAALERPFA
jgi:hypothetical protein